MNRGKRIIWFCIYGLLVIFGWWAGRQWMNQEVEALDRPFLVGGVQLNESDLDHWVNTVKNWGMNTVVVLVNARHTEWYDPYLWFKVEDLEGVRMEIRKAKAAGLNVVLKMHVTLDNYWPANKFLWHGMIAPLDKERQLLWFDNYRNYVCLQNFDR